MYVKSAGGVFALICLLLAFTLFQLARVGNGTFPFHYSHHFLLTLSLRSVALALVRPSVPVQ